MTFDDLQPVAVPPGEGKLLGFLSVQHKLVAAQTGGAIYLFESEFGPDTGNRLHVHQHEDEFAYVIEGASVIRLGDRELEIGSGGIAFLPRGIPHAIQNPLHTPSRYLFAAIPGESLERCFEAVQSAAEAGTLDDRLRRELFLQHGVEYLE